MKDVRGFSLIELMAALAIAGILASVAAPNLRALVLSQQLRAATTDLFDAITLARAQAIARNRTVKLAPADPEGADWTRGWTVFVDRDGDRVASAADEVLSVHGPVAAGMSIRFGFANPAPPYYIAYNGAGRSCSDTNSMASRPGTLSLFHGDHARRIKINMLGRARVCDPARGGDCDGAAAP